MLRLDEGMALEDQLHKIAVALVVGPWRLWRRSFAADQAYILDLVAHTMLHDRIAPIDDGRNDLCIPDQKAAIARIGVKHKAHADIVALAFDAINATPLAAKPDPFGPPDADAISGLIGPCGESLGHCTLDVVGDPRDTSRLCILVHLVF
jgi:hypothetical protein